MRIGLGVWLVVGGDLHFGQRREYFPTGSLRASFRLQTTSSPPPVVIGLLIE